MVFAHLHVHSYFSLLDGAAPVRELCVAAREMGMTALALTDHNGLHGAVRFFQAAREAGIKPIIGVEFDVERQEAGDRRQETGDRRTAHLVVLALDNEGYSNLCRLVTAARLGKARRAGPFAEEGDEVDRKHPVLMQEDLRRYCGHLIALSGCMRGEIAQHLLAKDWPVAEKVARYYAEVFGPDNFHMELQNNLLPPPYNQLRHTLQNFAGHLELPVVATNDVHYVSKDYAPLQDILICIRNLHTVDEPDPERKLTAEYSLKSPGEMEALFADMPEAIAATEEIVARCNWELDLDTLHLPKFDLGALREGMLEDGEEGRFAEFASVVVPPADLVRVGVGRDERRQARVPAPPVAVIGRDESRPYTAERAGAMGVSGSSARPVRYASHFPIPEEGEDTRSYLRRACEAGALKLYGAMTPKAKRRIEHELRVIEDQDLSDYFLIVWDIARYARRRGIPCTGRGSAADSIVSYLLEITAVDPIAHDLLFERFLNPMRRSMPDIDLDFCSERRDIVTRYVYEKYGTDHVAAVCTLNTFRARSAIREVGKALGLAEDELGQIAKAFPHTRASDIVAATEKFPEVRDAGFYLKDKGLLFDLCEKISGFPRHLSVHVGGVLIGAEPLTNISPLELASKGIVISQFDKDDVGALGLVKMDLLGLRIHTAIDHCLDEVERHTGERIDIERVPLDDEEAFKLIRSTHTIGLFQLESPGQRNLLGRAQPTQFEEIIANISLFRPGPVQSDMIRPYLARRHGQEPVTYLHPALEPVLKSTYGVIIYQEQVLEIANAVAGFTLGEGDQLRRAMTSDRSPEEMATLERPFIEGAMRRGIEPRVAQEIFKVVSGFAAYGFNKAHAACFGKISYQTAYLKAHYPAEFLAGILSAEPMGFYPARTVAEEAKRLGIAVLPPCVNRSEGKYVTASSPPGPLSRAPLRGDLGEGENGNGILPPWPPSLEGRREASPPGPLSGTERGRTATTPYPPGPPPSEGGGGTTRTATDAPFTPLPALACERPREGGGDAKRLMGGRKTIRIGLRFLRGMSGGALESILQAREEGRPFTSLRDFCERTCVPHPVIENLIMARAFAFTGMSEQELLWLLSALPKSQVTCRGRKKPDRELEFEVAESLVAQLPRLHPTSAVDRVALDLHLLGVSTTVNPFFFWREKLHAMGITPSSSLHDRKHGETVRVAGIVIARARPPTRSGKTAIFISLEDEYGLIDVAVFEDVYQRCGRALYANSVLAVEGKLTRLGLLDLSVTAREVIGLGSWQDFGRRTK